jgi:hypothetical protein
MNEVSLYAQSLNPKFPLHYMYSYGKLVLNYVRSSRTHLHIIFIIEKFSVISLFITIFVFTQKTGNTYNLLPKYISLTYSLMELRLS